LGEFGLLVMDEANLAFGSLESHLVVHLSRMDVESMGISFPQADSDWHGWQMWANVVRSVAELVSERTEDDIREARQSGKPISSAMTKSVRTARSVSNRICELSNAKGDWVVQHVRHGFLFTPIWVADYGNFLFRSIPKVLLMSAILSPKSADSIGVPEPRQWSSTKSHFPPDNTPIWHIPTIRINYRTDSLGTALWASRIDQIISRRLDRKGIVFTVSYDRRNLLLQRSRFADIMVSHSTSDVVEMVRRFKAMPPPAVLVSPAVTSGWDFMEDECRYIIIGKVPYPDTKDPVMVARSESDKEWTSFVAMETLVQESGRGSRSQSDKCEVLIIDDSWRWYYRKYRHYSPGWFQDRVKGSLLNVPDPLI